MMNETTTKLGVVRVRVIDAATAAALETAVNTFLRGLGTPAIAEERVLSILYQNPASNLWSVLIAYVE